MRAHSNSALYARRKRSGSADSGDLEQSWHEPRKDPDAFTGSNHGCDDDDEKGEDHTHKSPSHAWQTCNIRVFRRVVQSEVGCALEAVIAFVVIGLFIAYICLHHHHRKVIFHIMHDPIGHGVKALKGRSGFRHHFYTKSPRTVTIVMPSVVLPEKRTRRLDAISDTWGPNARAIYVVHNTSEFPEAAKHAVIGDGHPRPQDPYSFPQLLLVPPTIADNDGVPRLIHVIETIYEKINPDFAFFVNDHTFVIPEHLCKYLEDKEPSKDLNAGHAMKTDQFVFNSGAAGYVLSRETMRRLVEQWKADDPLCTGKDAAQWLQGNPALLTTKCMMEKLNVHAIDTRSHGKYHRFHAFPLTRSVSGDVDQWYLNKHEGMDKLLSGADESYNTLLKGADCCSQDSITFHYVEYLETKAIFDVREKLLKNPHMSDRDIKSLMISKWPNTQKDIGGYGRGLPKETDNGGWAPLIQVMRKISIRQNQREC